ncbi:MAG TPA: RteC domain-containing protein [Chitinophagaceae bacterium]|nr:RteC domain-containing protein [Chitinophagaceae bacterium]
MQTTTIQFKQSCEELYQELLSEVYQCRRLNLSPTSRIAYCFKLSVEYWNKLRHQVKQHPFNCDEEEIWFFKTMKPKFTALIEYYTMIYNAELFMPRLKTEEIKSFWKKESDKVKNFYYQYADFCEYYKSGAAHNDHCYFLRSNAGGAKCNNKVYEIDEDLITSHGHLATFLLAYDMYDTYILQQLRTVA